MKIASRFFSLLICALASLSVFASEATPDQDRLTAHLQRTHDKFLSAVAGLSEAQWNYKAGPDRWSIAECTEHIAASEPFIRGAVVKALQQPVGADTAEESGRKDDTVVTFIVDRSNKFKAPEPLVPTSRFASVDDAVASFKKERGETVKLAQSGADLRGHTAKHPGFGTLDAYGWLLFLSGHSERHTLQIEEVKANADFPKE
jgi:hypothetical protein